MTSTLNKQPMWSVFNLFALVGKALTVFGAFLDIKMTCLGILSKHWPCKIKVLTVRTQSDKYTNYPVKNNFKCP